MSGNTFGSIFRVTTFGESHGAGLGVTIDGVPAGIRLDPEQIQCDLDRRRPGQSAVSTMRQESDKVEILSGVMDGVTTGTALAMLIRNTDQRSRDYGNLAACFRPGHADYGYFKKYGIRDYRGGGRSSGRETAMRVAAGSVAAQLLDHYGIKVRAYTVRLAGIPVKKIDLAAVESNIVRSADPDVAEAMIAAIRKAQEETDSVGGVIECRADGVPAGLGEPVFDKLDALLGHAVLSIGGVKAVEFGEGFHAAELHGSENNDAMSPEGYLSNHAGGILGGISNGNPIVFRVAMKPTASIAREQRTVDENGDAVKISIHGRHDPCLVPRAVPVVEAMTALVLADALLRQRSARL